MNDAKICRDCCAEKPLAQFSNDKSKRDGKVSYCKPCAAIRKVSYYSRNKERLREYSRRYHHDNCTSDLKRREKAEYHKSRTVDLEKRRQYHADRYRNDPGYAMGVRMRAMLQRLLKKTGGNKSDSLKASMGYSVEKLMERIEYQFKPGMTWDNLGEWEIDHKIPLMRMIRRGEARPSVVNSLANLQPLWRHENRSKGCRYVG
ncbi:HNH endonuclease [Paracoccus phage vB_PmaP_KLEP18-1]|nr:HNH endonuclease [Paracoccus phage vB_PmaP_KLEP18-1]